MDPTTRGAISYRPYCFSAHNYDAENGPNNPRYALPTPTKYIVQIVGAISYRPYCFSAHNYDAENGPNNPSRHQLPALLLQRTQLRRREWTQQPEIVVAISYRPYCFSAHNYDAENGPNNPRYALPTPTKYIVQIVGAISYRPYCFSAHNYDAENGPNNPRPPTSPTRCSASPM
ncbi:putative glycerophosphoryl diester phosphodiesterase [Operophtera brumata]|uniref:Putative glycerophosphoryl diester phosphodiesterase n=1 Tax=Operophtera brumata TaxID=104452 RepID=A0A0L7L1P3_OPEBR|nr:putative glycerophosphoryl diester phosphodiesterase [Operophtera brumata]